MVAHDTLHPTITGDELLATVLTSHASHLQTHTAIVDADKNGFVAAPQKFAVYEKDGEEW